MLAQDFTWSLQYTPFSIDGGMHHFLYVLKRGCRRASDMPDQLIGYDPAAHAIQGGLTHDIVDQENYLMHIDL